MKAPFTKQQVKCFLGFHGDIPFHVGNADGFLCSHCTKTIITKDLRTNKIFKRIDGYTLCPRFGLTKPEWSCYLFCGKYLGENQCGERESADREDIPYRYVPIMFWNPMVPMWQIR